MKMQTHVTESQIRKRLASEVVRAGGVRALAREWRLSPTVISMTTTGRRKPGPSILDRLDIRATVKVTRRVVYAAAP